MPSNQVPPGEQLLSEPYIEQLRQFLGSTESAFAELYGVGPHEPFAMEIEFRVTADGVLALKQARPWVFEVVRPQVPDSSHV